ncbi:hypothetical protein [Brumicola pallidula]|jgi:uncharacterized membrane protein YqjE|uniref:Uncharacterized protein n=1 Tax=Brumicola pallidula DSM 14239 = ACAM 615 TaxID=1121922 RepID=K6ZWE5_9ALTE|nr:hypothetical protein [Glaciecola pallidula]GAC27645.1 hypothetical protein GPAL_0765 [Glaciecola pallidula DSM 14239 = ACAM 615]
MKKSTNLIASFALFTVITLVIYIAFKLVAAGYYITALIPITLLLVGLIIGIWYIVKQE